MINEDLRPLLLSGCVWYESLTRPAKGEPSAWYCTKGELQWSGQLLSVAAEYAQSRELLEIYRKRLNSIGSADLSPERARAFGRSVSSPIWVIVHELIVACYLERVLGWEYLEHEPKGYKTSRGDWEFRSPDGQVVFVEVKTAEEPDPNPSTGVYSRSVKTKQVRGIVKGAYTQLPDDTRRTLLVIVGRDMLDTPFGIMFGDIFQTLFGQFQVRFRPFEKDSELSAGPSFREMLVHGTKHRRLGCVAGFELTGLDEPRMNFYAIDNPYAYATKRLSEQSFVGARRFFVNEEGQGEERTGFSFEDAWLAMRGAGAS